MPEGDLRNLAKQNGGARLTAPLLRSRVGLTLNRNWPMWYRERSPSLNWLVVGGGPSVKRCWKAIAELQRRGAAVVTVNKSHDAALENGVKPWAHVLLDAQERVAGYVEKPRDDVLYFVASQCHWRVFKALPRKQIRLWHASQDFDDPGRPEPDTYLREKWPRHDARPIAGGTTVGHRAMIMGHTGFGVPRFHLFGFDSSRDLTGAMHGYAKAEIEGVENGDAAIIHDDQRYFFSTNVHMARQLADFDKFLETLPEHYASGNISKAFRLIVYGSGLLPFWAARLGLHADERCNADPRLVGGYCNVQPVAASTSAYDGGLIFQDMLTVSDREFNARSITA